jgi:urease accessory protein
MRGQRPFVFAQVKAGKGVAEIAAFLETTGGLDSAAGTSGSSSCAGMDNDQSQLRR